MFEKLSIIIIEKGLDQPQVIDGLEQSLDKYYSRTTPEHLLQHDLNGNTLTPERGFLLSIVSSHIETS